MRYRPLLGLPLVLCALDCLPARAQAPATIATTLKWSERMALSEMKRNPDPRLLDFQTQPKWEYTHGLLLLAIDGVRRKSADPRYLDYILSYYDRMIDEDGTIRLYDITGFNIDRVNPGRVMFALARETGKRKYTVALHTLRRQLEWQPRTREGGFWHKLVYPYQMWLDGAYMGSPFYAQYGKEFGDTAAFTDVAHQLILMNTHMRDGKTGLLYHGWDESRLQAWADPGTGTSPNFWGRAMGWYAMALVDVLEVMPADHPQRAPLVAILNDLVTALAKYQEPKTGLWYQVVDQGAREGNYLEASASAMFVYAIAKGVRLGALDRGRRAIAEKGYAGILSELISVDANGEVHLNRVCAVAGLGGSPYRDGTYDYYVHETIRSDDPKGVGPFIMASLELDR